MTRRRGVFDQRICRRRSVRRGHRVSGNRGLRFGPRSVAEVFRVGQRIRSSALDQKATRSQRHRRVVEARHVRRL